MRIYFLTILFAVSMLSCNSETDPEKPEISNLVAENHDGGSEIPRSGTISVNFDAQANGDARLDYYHIEIHDHPESGKISDEYRIINDDFKGESTFSGLRNAHVHQHISVPDTANLGEYHVVVTIVDDAGYSVDTENGEVHITIIE